MKTKMKRMMMVLGCTAMAATASAKTETGCGAFRFLDGAGDSLSLFGVRLGQKMDVAEVCQPQHNGIEAKSKQYEYCKFTPCGGTGDSRFNNYTICLDRTNRQVVAVFASARLKCGPAGGTESSLADFFGYVFGKLGNCETCVADEMWQSGFMEWVFFFPAAGSGFVASSHDQFGEAVCFYNTDAMVFDRAGFAHIVPDKPSGAKPWCGRLHSPAVELFRKCQSANNSTTSLFARHLALSEKLLKSERIAATTNQLANAHNVGCFDWVHISSNSTYRTGAEAAYNLDGYNGNSISMECRLYRFKANEDAFDFGIAQMVNEPLPASVLAGKTERLEAIPDICLIRREGLTPWQRRDGHAGAVLIRANAVLVCEIRSETVDIGAGLSSLFNFYKEFADE